MGTNTVISIVDGERTVVKCVAGCSNSNEFDFADKIADLKLTDPHAIKSLSDSMVFGCKDCAVIQSSDWISDPDLADDRLYIGKFADPRFNPRWDRGTSANLILIHIDQGWLVEDVNESRSEQ